MHQEREYPGRLSGTALANPDFAALAPGLWRMGRDGRADRGFRARARPRAQRDAGVRLLHLKTDIEVITDGTTISAIRNR